MYSVWGRFLFQSVNKIALGRLFLACATRQIMIPKWKVLGFVSFTAGYSSCTNSQGSTIAGSVNSVHQFQVPLSPSLNRQQVFCPLWLLLTHFVFLWIFRRTLCSALCPNSETIDLCCCLFAAGDYCGQPVSTTEHSRWFRQLLWLLHSSPWRNWRRLQLGQIVVGSTSKCSFVVSYLLCTDVL